jgi:hypothetical protein
MTDRTPASGVSGRVAGEFDSGVYRITSNGNFLGVLSAGSGWEWWALLNSIGGVTISLEKDTTGIAPAAGGSFQNDFKPIVDAYPDTAGKTLLVWAHQILISEQIYSRP